MIMRVDRNVPPPVVVDEPPTAVPQPPTPSALWYQAYAETCCLPSWERGEKCRARYREMLIEHGHLVRRDNPNGREPDVLPCGYPLGRRVAP